MRCKAYIGIALLGATFCWAATPGSEGDFIGSAREIYPAYSTDRYIRYAEGFAGRRAMYDRLGQFMSYGSFGLRWDEVRDRYSQEKIDAGLGLKQLNAQSEVLQQNTFFNFLGIVRESYGDQSMAMTLGRNISSTFSPLVFNQMQYGGLRVDYHSPRHDLTFLMSRGGFFGSALYSDLLGSLQGASELSPVLVGGANWVGRFGALKMGANFYRQVQSNIKSDPASLWRGDVPYPELRSPKQIKVRVRDDSPRDLGGVVVLGADIFVRGLVDSIEQRFTSASERAGADLPFAAGLRPIFEGRLSEGNWVADGADEYVDIIFNLASLPADLVGIESEIEVVVEGDYRIAVRQLHDFEILQLDGSTRVEERSWPHPPPVEGTSNVYFKDRPYQEEPFYTVVRSKGSPGSGDGPQIVRFKHAIPTAQTFYGANFELDTKRLSLSGEYVLNPQDFKFPTRLGRRYQKTARAGYVTALGKLGNKGNIGGEIFRLDPTYGGWYDSRRGGLILFTDVAGDVKAGVHLGRNAITQEFKVFDDNDDHDNWPDDRPFSGDALYTPQGAFDRPVYTSGLPEGGVYPGYDMNGDLVLDFDRNRNAVADWIEPFVGFDVEPPEFVYGIDFNNNLVPDFRENDDEPDYPYRRDQQGAHLFYDFTYRPWWMSKARLGWYRATEVVGGHRAQVAYARLGAELESPKFWARFKDDIKRVRDDIPDDLFRLVLTTDSKVAGRFNEPRRPPLPDFLPMRNSLVNTGHVETGWLPLAGLEVENTFKYIVNKRLEDEGHDGAILQAGETLHNFSLVNKISYQRKILPQLTLSGRLKHLLARWDEGSFSPIDSVLVGQETSWSLFMPEVLASYRLTAQSSLEFGQHGLFLPFLEARFHDRLDKTNRYTSNTSLMQLAMRGEYGGYNMLAHIGLRREIFDVDSSGSQEDTDLTAFFVDLIFGVE